MRWHLSAVVAALLVVPAAPALSDNGLITKPSAHSAAETADRLEQAITSGGFMVFGRLDHADAAKKHGLAMPYSTVVVFGNPKLGTPNFIQTPPLAIDLPLKALVWDDKAGRTWLSYNSAAYLYRTIYVRHGQKFDDNAVGRVEGVLAAIAEEATRK